jgi:hypothetical protein
LYCSNQCKKIGKYSTVGAALTNDPIKFINENAAASWASYVRFAFRQGTAEWRFYPHNPLMLPFTELPPLPKYGEYRIQLFDERWQLIREHELCLVITAEHIKQFCKITDGSRNSMIGR